jgi:cytoskeletal protein RodZ
MTTILGAAGAIVGWLSPDPVRLSLLPVFLVFLYLILWFYYQLRITSPSTGKPRIPAWLSGRTSSSPSAEVQPKEAPVAKSSGESGGPSITPNSSTVEKVKPVEAVSPEAPQVGMGSSSENDLKKKPEIQP